MRKKSDYTAKDIVLLQGLEPVRQRPGMYIGSTGSEGLHHLIWEVVDNSVTYKTPVVIKEERKIKIRAIGKIIDEIFRKNSDFIERTGNGETEILRKGFNLKVLSFDSNTYKLGYQPVFSLIRHKVNSKIYRVTLQNGRQIEITPYHSLFTLKRGEVLPIKGTDLEIGIPIVVPKVWPEVENSIKEIDLIDEFLRLSPDKTKRLYIYNLTGLLKKDERLSSKLKSQLPKYQKSRHRSNIWYDYLRYDYLPFNLIRKLSDKELKKIKKENPLLGNKRSDGWKFNFKLKITKELIELLGIFAAEGTIIENQKIPNRIIFSFGAHEKSLIDYTVHLIEEVFNFKLEPHYVHKTARTVAVNSHLVSLIFKEIIKTGRNSSDKRVPDLIFNLNQTLKERYVIGYLAGDGYPTKIFINHLINNTTPDKDERRKFTMIAKNQDLAVTFSYLLSSLNKTYSFRTVLRKKKVRFLFINYKGKIKKNRFNPAEKLFRIDFYWNTNSSYFNYLPFDEIIEKCFDKPVLNQRNNGQIGISHNKVLTLLEKQKVILNQKALLFLNSDLGILRIKKIEEIKYNHPWVYDISVPNGENFVAGFSPIIAHNSIDEAIAEYCNEIEVSLLPDNRVMIKDNGRGIPVEAHPQTKKSALETVMTYLHAGAKFGGKTYRVSGGLHGVGVSVVCALSKWMRAEVCREGKRYYQEYSRGIPKTPVKQIGKCDQTGTTVIFEPDPEIFKKIEFSWKKIIDHLREQAYLVPKLKIRIKDKRKEPYKSCTFYFEGGIKSLLQWLTEGEKKIQENIFYVKKEVNNILTEVAFCYTDDIETEEISFANNIRTREGGTHLTGFRAALTRTLQNWGKENKLLTDKEKIEGEDTREGLDAVISVRLPQPQFEGQTKQKLGNPEARTVVESVVSEALSDFLEKNPRDGRAIIGKCLLAARSRKAAKAAKESVLRKGVMESFALPGKLSDCSCRDPEQSELFLVEGESAGGSSRQARDKRFQAVLPLRGKILNVERVHLNRLLASQEIKSLIIALGTGIGNDFDISKLRYHKIILMADSDVDGQHLTTLLLTLFYRYFKPIIERGYLYIAQPPLYKIQSGKEVEYAYTESEKEEVLKRFGQKPVSIQRYKGLGEMNPEELWSTTMNPEKRILRQVTIENSEEADKIFDILMGKEVLPRKQFIQTYAKEVKNLDI